MIRKLHSSNLKYFSYVSIKFDSQNVKYKQVFKNEKKIDLRLF